MQLETKHGTAAFAVGDRVQFTDTDKKLRIYNGNVGTITRLDPSTGEITATLDAAGKDGREVRWSAADFEGFRHGYAGTIGPSIITEQHAMRRKSSRALYLHVPQRTEV